MWDADPCTIEHRSFQCFQAPRAGSRSLARATEAGIEVDSLLRKAGLTRQQVDDAARVLAVKDQIRFSSLRGPPQTIFSGFTLPGLRSADRRRPTTSWPPPTVCSRHSVGVARYSTIANEGIALTVRDNGDLGIIFDHIGVVRAAPTASTSSSG
jgi:hypothetical protein